MAYLALVIILLLSTPANASTVFDMSEHSGIIRDSAGNYSKVSANGSVRSLTSNTALALVEKPIIQTSKGALEVTLNRIAAVDVTRLGNAVSKFSQRVGPLSMALATVDLICTLSSICKSASGLWEIPADPVISGYPTTLSTKGYYYIAGINSDPYKYPSPETGCRNAASVDKFWGNGYTGSGSGTGASACTTTKTADGTTNQTSISFSNNTCPAHYSVSGTTCVLTGNPNATTPTATDWANKASLLNDSRFTPDLFNANENVPITTPVLSGSPVSVGLGTTTKTLKDGSGTVTGSESAVTSLSITDGATNNTPNVINITETTINTTYNTSNVVTGSTTTISDPVQPIPPNKTDPLEIKFDTVNDTPLTQKVVTAPFTTTSWGSGECPPDIAMNLTRGNYSIDSQPFCDFAISLKPVLLLVAALAGTYIVITSTRPTAS